MGDDGETIVECDNACGALRILPCTAVLSVHDPLLIVYMNHISYLDNPHCNKATPVMISKSDSATVRSIGLLVPGGECGGLV